MKIPDSKLPESLEQIRDFKILSQMAETPEGEAQLEDLIQKALLEYSGHGLPHAAWSWLLAKNNRLTDAIAAMDQAMELGPEEFRVVWQLNRGMFFSMLGNGHKALKDMTESIKKSPKEPTAHVLRGLELKKLGDGLSGVLEEQIGLVLNGTITETDLYQFIYQYIFYTSPEHLKSTLQILCEPLHAGARAFRAEMLMNLGIPSAAFHDYQVATRLDPKNLGFLVRLEDIQHNGLMASSPLIQTENPNCELWPFYQKLLDDYTQFWNSIVIVPDHGLRIGLIEKIFGRASKHSTFDLNRSSWNMFCIGLALTSSYWPLSLLGPKLSDSIANNQFHHSVLQYNEIKVRADQIWHALSFILVITYYIGMMINLGGFIQWILKCRIADLQAKLHSFHLLMRFPLMYLFVLFCTLFVSLHIKLQEYLILICSEELDSIIQMLR